MTTTRQTALLAIAAAFIAVGSLALKTEGADPGYTIPATSFTEDNAANNCTSLLAGCTGELVGLSHSVAGTITVIDDCTFKVEGFDFDGLGPAVYWWAAKAEGADNVFPFPANAKRIASFTEPGSTETVAGKCRYK